MAKTTRLCTITGCERVFYARGWCSKHYLRWYTRGGDPSINLREQRDQEESLADQVNHRDRTSGCWIWAFSSNGNGYGVVPTGSQKHSYVHRRAVELDGRDINGLVVRHVCDNPSCYNPSHLITGSHADNSQDAVDRGRWARGESHGMAKLTANDVRTIRQELASGERQTDIAARFEVTPGAIGLIARGQTWRSVGLP